jgi:16S rRNA processing protein RimM
VAEKSELLEIGTIGRAHGLKGEVSVNLSTNVADRLVVGGTLDTDRGRLTVRTIRPHQQRQLVTFDGVDDRTAAEALMGVRLLAEPLDAPPEDGYWVHDLIGARVREPDGTERGVVSSIEANPASDLLVLDSGALVPVRFVSSVLDGVVEVDVPEGLFDL